MQKIRTIGARIIAIASQGQAEAGGVVSQHLHHGGERQGEAALAAIRLRDGHIQITGKAGGIEIVDGKGAGGDLGLIDEGAALPYGDPGIALGHPAHHGGKAPLEIRQHGVVAGELHAGEGHAVEAVARGEVLPQGQLGFAGGDIPLRIAV
ncbi:hypothetical protein D3C75_588480 [compost metagenome]